ALSGTVDDNAAVISVTVDSQTNAATNNGDGTWTLADGMLTVLAEGTFDVSVTATDPVGNADTDASNNELVIDTTAPVVTVDLLTTNDTTPALSGTVDDTAAGIVVTVDGQTNAATNNGDGTWTLADGMLTVLAEGTYDVSVTATDPVGNAGTDATLDELLIDSSLLFIDGSVFSAANGTVRVIRDGDVLRTTDDQGVELLPSRLAAVTDEIEVVGRSGEDDQLVITLAAAGSVSTVSFLGDSGADILSIGLDETESAASVDLDLTATADGTIGVDDVDITFGSVETIDMTGLSDVASHMMQFSASDDEITISTGGLTTAGFSYAVDALGTFDVDGGAGNDTIDASLVTTPVTIDGGDGDDVLDGGSAADVLRGGEGADLVIGHGGDDSILGGSGDDVLKGGGGDDDLQGEAGNDTLRGHGGTTNVLDGGDGVDSVFASGDLDFVLSDTSLTYGSTTNTLSNINRANIRGGASANVISARTFSGPVTLAGLAGADSIVGTEQNDRILGKEGVDTLLGLGGNDHIEGGDGDDAVDGGSGNDHINGNRGDDILLGFSGNDTVLGGSGSDVVLGGTGDDTVNGQGNSDTVAGNDGVDKVVASVDEIDETFVAIYDWVDSV
ncbi:MAG: Ig-like domain-containing protein, partial [Planctomycetaceae bacterium]